MALPDTWPSIDRCLRRVLTIAPARGDGLGPRITALMLLGTAVPALAPRRWNFSPSRDICITTSWRLPSSSGTHLAPLDRPPCPHIDLSYPHLAEAGQPDHRDGRYSSSVSAARHCRFARWASRAPSHSVRPPRSTA